MENYKLRTTIEEGKQLYFKKFYENLNSSLIKHFGLNEASKILKAIEKGILNISNIQSFFSTGRYFSDPSFNIEIPSKTTLEYYLAKVLYKCKEESYVNPEINIAYFLIYIMKNFSEELKTEEGINTLKEFFNNFLYAFLEPVKENKIKIKVFENLYKPTFGESYNFNNKLYRVILKVLLEVYKSVHDKIPKSYSIPKIKIIHYITEYTRVNQIHYIEDIYNCGKTKGFTTLVKKVLNNIPDLGEDTPELRASLSFLKGASPRSDITEFFEESIIAELKYIKENCDAKSFISSINPEIMAFWNSLLRDKVYPEKYNIIRNFIPITEVYKLVEEAFAEVIINCDNFENFAEIKTFINLAAELVLVRYREIKHKESPTLNIVLNNIPWNTMDIVGNVKEEEAKLTSKYNVKFNIIPYIKQESTITKYGHSEPHYFRIISDIHIDVNRNMKYSFNFGKDYVLCCGDIAGDFRTARGWLNVNVQKGAYVTGNHLGYSSAYPERNGEEGLKEKYGMQFHPDNTRNKQTSFIQTPARKGTNYLNNTVTEINGIKIFGAPLYTNFELFGKTKADSCAMLCQHKINDFKYVKIYRDREVSYLNSYSESWETVRWVKPYITNLTPDICKFYFNRTINKFKDYCKSSEYNGEPLIFMSHFGVSIHSITDRYKSDPVSAYFASDMVEIFRGMLQKGVNIRMAVHGHIHDKNHYILKYPEGEILVIAEPFGYYTEREDNQIDQSNYGYRVSFRDINSGKPWSKIKEEEILSGEIKVHRV